jgi:membrane protease YdiL (CAAX protease family)/tetratricopeptide (TPR) repeat protein
MPQRGFRGPSKGAARLPKLWLVVIGLICVLSWSSADARTIGRFIANHDQLDAELAQIDEELVLTFRSTRALRHSREPERAVELYERILKKAPGFDPAIYRLGIVKFELGDRREGLDLLKRAYAMNPRPATSYWIAKCRWICHREADPCADPDEYAAILPLALEGFRAYPRVAEVLELAIEVAWDAVGPSAVDAIVEYAADPSEELGGTVDYDADRVGTKAALSWPPKERTRKVRELDDNLRAGFHYAHSKICALAKGENPKDSLIGLVNRAIRFPGMEDSPEVPSVVMWLVEVGFEKDPQEASRTVRTRVGSLVQRTDDPEITTRYLRLLIKSEKVRPRDPDLLRSILWYAENQGDEPSLEYFVERIGEHLEETPDDHSLLNLQAKAAQAVSDWETVAAVAARLDELEPRGDGTSWADELLADYDGSRFGLTMMRARSNEIKNWMWMAACMAGGIVAGLFVFFFLKEAAIDGHEKPTDQPEEDLDADSGDDRVEIPPGMVLPGEGDAPRWPRTAAAVEGVVATALLTGGVFFLAFGLGSGPVSGLESKAAQLGIVMGAYVALVFTVGWILRTVRCEVRIPQDSIGKQWLDGLLFGLILLLSTVAASFVQGLMGLETREQQWIVDLFGEGGSSLVVLGVVAILFVPLAEEMYFRGYLFERLFAGGSPVLAYGLSALFFAAVHLNLSSLAVYVVQGVVLASAYHHRGSITTAAVAHTVNNATAFALMIAFQ